VNFGEPWRAFGGNPVLHSLIFITGTPLNQADYEGTMLNQSIIKELDESLPVVFARNEIEKIMPGVISSKTLANLDSAGQGPPRYKHNRKVIYEKKEFIAWLTRRIKRVEM